jgi:hypothetical protein
MEAISFSETLVPAYKTTAYHISEHHMLFFLDGNYFVDKYLLFLSRFTKAGVSLYLYSDSTRITVFSTMQGLFSIIRRIRKVEKSAHYLHFRPSVCPHE